jgi:hypothetical protein
VYSIPFILASTVKGHREIELESEDKSMAGRLREEAADG